MCNYFNVVKIEKMILKVQKLVLEMTAIVLFCSWSLYKTNLSITLLCWLYLAARHTAGYLIMILLYCSMYDSFTSPLYILVYKVS